MRMLSFIKKKKKAEVHLLELVFIKTSLSVYIFGKQNKLYNTGYKMLSFTAKILMKINKKSNESFIVLRFRMQYEL